MLERGEKEGSELALVPAQAFEIILIQEAGEEALHQVFGVLVGVALSPNKGIQRVPIRLAQILEGDVGFRGCATARRNHHRPAGWWRNTHAASPAHGSVSVNRLRNTT